MTRNGLAIAACRLASSKIVDNILTKRKKQVGNLLRSIRTINSFEIKYDIKEHSISSEPYFYDNAYQIVDRSNVVLQINELGWCITNTAIRIDKETRRPKTWKCNDECKPVSDNDKRVIDLLQLSFKEPVRKVRETLDNLDSHCPHGHYSDYYGKDLLGHPLPCCISECFSELRTVQAASVHFPEVRSFLRLLYTARLSNATIVAIDNELSLADYNSLLSRIDVDEDSLDELLKKPDNYDSNHSILNQSDSLRNLESLLQVQYAGVTNNWLKEMNDDPEFACCSCERLHKRSGVTRVKLDSDKWKTEMWQTLLTYVKNCETDCNIDYYVSNIVLKN